MKKLLVAIVAGGLAASVAVAQYPVGLWTRPVAPPRDALDRLNLAMAWEIRVPTESVRDGFASIQHLGTQIIAQTRRGDIVALDPRTGATQWRAEVGNPYHVTHEVGYNDDLILATGATRVYAFDRANGEAVWAADLPATPSSPPAADADGFYICLSNGRLVAYAFPIEVYKGPTAAKSRVGVEVSAAASKGSAPPPSLNDRNYTGATYNPGRVAVSSSATVGNRSALANVADIGKRSAADAIDRLKTSRGSLAVVGPKLRWEYATNRRIQDTPVLSSKSILVVSTDKVAIILNKLGGTKPVELPTNGAISAPVGHYGETAYAADRDGTVYSYDLAAKSLLWTFSTHSTSTIRTEPWATDEDLFVNADLGGLIRLDRSNGVQVWQAPDAHRFLATNRKYVYATDKVDNLVVLDRARGSVLAKYACPSFPIPVANVSTDRLLLAAEDGSIVCLYDRAYPSPLMVRAAEPKIAQSAIEQKKPVNVPEQKLESKESSDPKPKADPADKPVPPEPKTPPEPKPKVPPKANPKAKGKG